MENEINRTNCQIAVQIKNNVIIRISQFQHIFGCAFGVLFSLYYMLNYKKMTFVLSGIYKVYF